MTAALLLLALAFPSDERPGPGADPVNAVIGDESWVVRFGNVPGPDAPGAERIRVHLEHVAETLHARDTSALSPAQRDARARNLDRLRAYTAAGRFPRNDVVPGRRPRFLDPYGNACAVGHLMIASGARALAERIDRDHEWAYLADLPEDDPDLTRWIASSGLTRTELATIQPGYDFERPSPPPPEPPPPVVRPGSRKRPDRALALTYLQRAEHHVQRCLQRSRLRVPRLRVVATWSSSGALTSVTTEQLPAPTQACVLRAVQQHLPSLPPFRGRPFRMAIRYAGR
jgi:hypothetical protein